MFTSSKGTEAAKNGRERVSFPPGSPEGDSGDVWHLNLESAGEMVEALRSGSELSDLRFDKIFSPRARRSSRQHWTPVAVAKRAASLLSWGDDCRILDVGSGVGKFCLIGALTTPASFFGVEQREWLVAEANSLARKLRIPRAHFFHRPMKEIDWHAFDGFYFYNPFYEQIVESARIDESIETGEERFHEYVLWARKQLAEAKVGTRVVTFHGFGGEVPPGYVLESREASGDDYLELWIKKKSVVSPAPDRAGFPREHEGDPEIPCTD